jgi:gamma-glutamyltranspeptidase/glutathione hydrolase
VVDDRNITGAGAVAVPGVIAGMDLAHRRHGRLPWRDLVQPAAKLAEQGMIADWYSGLLTASTAKALSRDPDAARMFLDDGVFAILGGWTETQTRHLDQTAMARTLAQIADEGAAAFYRGDIAQALVRDVQAKGGCLAMDDLQGYEAAWAEPLVLNHRGGTIWAPPGLTGGPTMAAAVAELARMPADGGTLAMARALHAAFDARLRGMGDHESPKQPGCTTHFSIVDRHGNFCSVTQTLLSIFGSRVVSPSTGLLLNNGIMWFDPEPGRPNSLGPGKRCLANYCPVVGRTPDGRQFALGASGGRKILGAVLQLADGLIAQGLNLEAAFHAPRIDVSGNQRQLIADHALPPAVLDALRAEFKVTTARRQPHPFAFACPAGVERAGGLNFGCTETASPWGDAVGERTV